MATVILVRHGRSTANTEGVLAGRTAGVKLDATGRRQAAATAERLADVPLARVVTSPLERCRQTARAIVAFQKNGPPVAVDKSLSECDYGDWQGRTLKELADEPLWATVQSQPSSAVFPGGESLSAMQARAVAAVRLHDREVEAEHGPSAVWVAVSHGDLIKSILADALGTHFDLFQRINVNPASVSIVRYGAARPDVVCVNTDAGGLSWLSSASPAGDAQVGGGAGPIAGDTEPS